VYRCASTNSRQKALLSALVPERKQKGQNTGGDIKTQKKVVENGV